MTVVSTSCGKDEPVNPAETFIVNGVTFNMVAIEGGTGMQVPAHPADELGTPYPRLVSFDEWDALYTKNVFVTTTGNTMDHIIHIHVEELPAAASISGVCSPRR